MYAVRQTRRALIRVGWALIGVMMLSANGDSQFMLPVRVFEGDGVEGGYRGGKLPAASAQNGY